MKKNKVMRLLLVLTLCASMLSACKANEGKKESDASTKEIEAPKSTEKNDESKGATGESEVVTSTEQPLKEQVVESEDKLIYQAGTVLGLGSETNTRLFDVLDDDFVRDYSEAKATITFNKDTIEATGTGYVIEGNRITIQENGLFVFSGTLDDGQIIVNSTAEKKVRLVLNGVDITCKDSSPIYVQQAYKTVVTLASETVNTLTDTTNYVMAEGETNEPNAALFSKDDLIINGNGKLIVNGNFKNGINTKDDLRIRGGEIVVVAANDGICGKDSIEITGGHITITANDDGMVSNVLEKEGKGYVLIEAGSIHITSGSKKGIISSAGITVNDGKVILERDKSLESNKSTN